MDRPLKGRSVVVTRAAEQADELASLLEDLGAEVLQLPLVAFAPVARPAPLDCALASLESFDWLFLTSQNTVHYVAARARAVDLDLKERLAPSRPRPRVAVVGRNTERAARSEGWRVDYASSGSGGIDLAQSLSGQLDGRRVVLPRSDRASRELPAALAKAGAITEEVVAYLTTAPPALDANIIDRITRGEVDVVSFASPSAFQAMIARLGSEQMGRLARRARFAAIGPTTSAEIRRAGFEIAIEAKVSTGAGLAAAIAAYYAGNPLSRKESA